MEEARPMNVDQMLEGVREAMTVSQVFGDPVERNGVTLIPAAKVRGGGGGGSDNVGNGGGGFGISAKPAGAYILRGDQVTWEPALDLNRIILGGQIVLIVAFWALRGI